MTTMHPPADRQCQIYENSVRCINDGARWVAWGKFVMTSMTASTVQNEEFYSWECADGHHFGEAA